MTTDAPAAVTTESPVAVRADAPIVASVRPAPDPGVLAAIVAAVEEAWPRPVPVFERKPRSASWRFSGRWWTRPSPARRDRPWTA